MTGKYLTFIGLMFASTASACNLADITLLQRVMMGTLIENPNYSQLNNLKETYQKVSSSCPDPLDTIELSLKISEVQILLGTGFLEAENQLLKLKNEIYPVKDYFTAEYQQIIGQLLSLYVKAGRQQLANFYAIQVLKEFGLEDDEIKLDALSITRPIEYRSQDDLNRLVEAIKKDNQMFMTSVLVPYRASSRYLSYLQRLLLNGAYRDLHKQARAIDLSDSLSKKTTFVSDNLLSIALTEEIASLKLSHRRYKLAEELKAFSDKKRQNISLENRLLIDLLSAFNRGSEREEALNSAITTFKLILNAYDYGRQIKMKPQINAVLASLLKAYPSNTNVQQAVFIISQHLFVTNPVAPVLKLEGEAQELYKQLVNLQQQLSIQLKSSEANNEKLILDIAQLASKFQASSRRSARSMGEVQSQLNRDETLFYAVDLGTESALFYISSLDFKVKVVDSKVLYQDILEHRLNIIERKDARHSGEKLSKKLDIDTIKSPKVSVVAFGAFEQLPVATLYNSQSKKWLIEEKLISHFSLLDRIGRESEQAKGASNRIAISDPVFYVPPPKDFESSPYFESQNSVIKLNALPDTLSESLALLGEHGTNSRLLLTQEDAVEKKVKNAINRGDWNFISFSTHTIFPSQRNSIPYPGLAMSIDFNDRNNDSILQADEIANLNIDNSSVLLAACNTANASEVGGSFNSLITSFQFAGASSVVASQWNVLSQETFEFMSEVAKLINSGAYSPQSAIREVQSKLARDLSSQKDSASVWGAWEIYQ